MSNPMNVNRVNQDVRPSRRQFLANSTLATGAALSLAAATSSSIRRTAHAAGTDTFRIGLIGSGGRGSGAAADAMTAMPNAKIVAMTDAFEDRVRASRDNLTEVFEDRVDVPDERMFWGLDGYQGVLENSDIVIIACTSRFHPYYTKAAVEAGKHVFVEKPHALDPHGIGIVLKAAETAKQNGTALVSGLCYRYDTARREAIERIRQGEIGDIVAVQCDYMRTPYNLVTRKPEWSEMEYQFRNWYHFTWMSGDDILQSLLHNLDSAIQVLDEELPVRAYGMGGRSPDVNISPALGNNFDHHAVIWDYEDGKRIYGGCRTAMGCVHSNMDVFHGTKGRCVFRATGEPKLQDLAGNDTWVFKGPRERDMYVQEHYEMLQSIANGNPINDGQRMARTTLVAIMGLYACYGGEAIEWQKMWDDANGAGEMIFGPKQEDVSFEMTPPYLPDENGYYMVSTPGITKPGQDFTS